MQPRAATRSRRPVAFGSRVLFLTEGGVTFVLDTGDACKEVANNDLANPYKIAR